MNDFKKNNGFRGSRGGDRGGRSFGGRPSFGGRGGPRGDRGGYSGGHGQDDRQMFEATCANCGKIARVPFRPDGSKPVYCKDCFAQMGHPPDGNFSKKEYEDRRPHGGRDFARDDRGPGGDHRPKPTHDTRGGPGPEPKPLPMQDNRLNDIKRQIDTLTVKVDQLIQMRRQSIAPKVEIGRTVTTGIKGATDIPKSKVTVKSKAVKTPKKKSSSKK